MTVWVIKGGPYGERDDRFLDHSIIGIPWPELGDLGAYPDRETLKAAYAAKHPGRSEGHVNAQVGQMWRFVHRMKIGDPVVLPFRGRREIAVGFVSGPYRWTRADAYGPDLRHVRDVTWTIPDVPRDAFDPDLLYSFGSSQSVSSATRNQAERRLRQMFGGEIFG
jgi:restriction system protein